MQPFTTPSQSTEDRDFYRDLEQDEIYNGRVPFDAFRSIVLERYRRWDSDRMIFECSLFQNIVEDMMLFQQAGDDEILRFYRQIRKALGGKDYRIIYLRAKDVRGNLETVRRERTDEKGNEIWFGMMLGYFNDCPYARARGLKGEEDLIRHLIRRQELELRLCREVFPDRSVVIESKDHSLREIHHSHGMLPGRRRFLLLRAAFRLPAGQKRRETFGHL